MNGLPKRLSAFLLLTLLTFHPQKVFASIYTEAGFGLASMSNAAAFFRRSTAVSTNMGSTVQFNILVPVTSSRNFFHFELGLVDRLSQASTTSGSSLSMATINAAVRVEIWRLYAGYGYGLLDYAGDSMTSLKPSSGASSYVLEGGLIWRVIPEFQIVAAYSLESAKASGGTSSTTVSEFGLRFRFPLFPSENRGGKAVDFDGFRYPFGFMK